MKLKIIIPLFSILSLYFSINYPMNDNNNIYKSYGLLIFLDDSEDRIGPISSDLITALAQKAGPIIASASLLGNIFSYQQKLDETTKKNHAELFKKFNYGHGDENDRKLAYLAALSFNENEWIFKKVNANLFLLIPIEYLQTFPNPINTNDVIEYNISTISPTELTLGLKVNHLKTIKFRKITHLVFNRKENSDYFVEALYNESTQTSSIFCTNIDYKNNNSKQIPMWTLYMNGHGNLQKIIVNLSINNFKEVLAFLENNINTKLLIYTSCYAAGLNNELIFKDSESVIQKTYPFAIITQAITDAPVMVLLVDIKLDKEDQLKLEPKIDFPSFLNLVRKFEIFDYVKITEKVFPIIPSAEVTQIYKGRFWGTVPQIKLPGIEWFSVLASKKYIVSIGSILVKTRNISQPLNIKRFFKSDPRAILLYASVIPFELIINGWKLETIISMIPGDAIHTIKKITSSTMDKNDILKCFMRIGNLEARKIFFIEDINNIKEVIISNNNGQWKAFYMQNEVLYKIVPNATRIIVDDPLDEREYYRLLDEAESYRDKKNKSTLTREKIERLKENLEKSLKKRKNEKVVKRTIKRPITNNLRNNSKRSNFLKL